MEDITEFKKWFYQLLTDAEKKLCMKDSTLADILIRERLNYYLRSICKAHETHQNQNLRH